MAHALSDHTALATNAWAPFSFFLNWALGKAEHPNTGKHNKRKKTLETTAWVANDEMERARPPRRKFRNAWGVEKSIYLNIASSNKQGYSHHRDLVIFLQLVLIRFSAPN